MHKERCGTCVSIQTIIFSHKTLDKAHKMCYNIAKIKKTEQGSTADPTKGGKDYIMKNMTQQYNDVHEFLNGYLAENPFTFRTKAIEVGIEYANEKGYDVEYIREQLSNALNNECYFATFKNLDEFCKQFEWA